MPYYVVRGTVPPKKHTVHKQADGSLAYEEMIGEEGFSGSASMLYHRRVPSAMIDSRPWDLGDLKTQPNYPLRPLHLRLGDLFPGEAYLGKDPVRHRRLVLGNGDVRINYVVADTTSPLYSNATGDECVYVQSGRARLESVFGELEVGAGDYVILPRTTIHRWVPLGVDDDGPLRFFCIEASSHIVHPRRHLSKYGQFLAGSPLTERDLRVVDGPSLAPHPEQEEPVDVYVKHRGRAAHGIVGSIVTHATHPFDVEGWDGYVYPYAFSVHDFEPVTGSIHQPPPAHQVLEGYNFVICNFVPRRLDYHPDAIPLPYYHSNVDSDEVLFYSGGDYTARKGTGIGVESLTLHPSGHSHGPQVRAYENAHGVTETDELAVMVDTFRPLEIGEGGMASDDGRYAWSWSGEGPDGPIAPLP